MASLGLLGALGGLGQGLTQMGSMFFSEQMEKEREARLQQIRDKEYNRARKDQLEDRDFTVQENDRIYERTRRDQLEDRDFGVEQEQRIYDRAREDLLADRAEARGWQIEDRDYENDLFSQFMVDDKGQVIGINRKGESENLFELAKVNPLLGEAIDAYGDVARRIDVERLTRENDPDAFAQLDRYANIIQAGFASSADSLGFDMSTGLGSTIGEAQILELGDKLFSGGASVDLDGTVLEGQSLIDQQERFKSMFPFIYQSRYGQR